MSSQRMHLRFLIALTLSTLVVADVARGASTATTVPATAAAASQPARAVSVDGTLVQPMSRCTWGDLLHVAVRGGKLEVESHPPDNIAGYLRNRRQIDVEITDATDRYWRLQGVARQQPMGPVGGGAVVLPGGARIRIGGEQPAPRPPVQPPGVAAPPGAVAAADNVEFTAKVLGRGRATERPQVAELMLMRGTFQIRGRWQRDGKIYQIDFRSYRDRTNVTLQVRELLRGRRAVVLSMEGSDLQQVRRERYAEVRTYLEPMLVEISGGARNALRPQAGDVYRAFESIPADSAALERVKRIVDTFDALEPAVREAASQQLNQLGRAEVLAAARLDRTELSAEQSLRLDAFVARHSAVTDIAAARRDVLFLIDCLEDDDRAVRAAALLQLRQTSGPAIEFDLDAPAEQRATAAAALVTPFLPPRRDDPVKR